MLHTFIHAGVLIACAGAAVAALRESRRAALRPGGWAGRWMVAAALLVLLDWLALLARDWRLTNWAGVLVSAVDGFVIVLGIAWVPCFLLLQLRRPVLRAVVYLAGCAAALVWIGWHLPTHAVAPGVRADTQAMTVAVPLLGFALLNFVLVVRRAAKSASPEATEVAQVRLAWGAAAMACVGAMGFAVRGWWWVN